MYYLIYHSASYRPKKENSSTSVKFSFKFRMNQSFVSLTGGIGAGTDADFVAVGLCACLLIRKRLT